MAKFFEALFNKKVWNALWSALDRPISRLIDRAAASVPEDSLARGDVGGVLIAEIASILESFAGDVKGFPGANILSVAMEKASDYIEAFNHALGREKGTAGAKEVVVQKFWADGKVRLAAATDKAAELKKLKAEFKVLMAYIDFVEKEEAKRAAKGLHPINWSTEWPRIKAVIIKVLATISAGARWVDGKLGPVAGWTGTLRGVQTKGKLW